MKKILIFLLLFFGIIINSYADSWHFDLSDKGNLSGNENYKIGTLTINYKSNINFDFQCRDNDENGEIRIYLSGTTFFWDCHNTLNNDYVNESGYWKNIESGTYELIGINTQNKNWNWGFGVLDFNSRRVLSDESGGTGGISQTFIDLDLSSYEYKPSLISASTFTGETVMIDYSIPFSNINKNLYEIKLLIMIIGIFHLMWVFYTIKNDLLGKN